MLMDLGANVYSEDFEQHFLLKAAEFYQVGASFSVNVDCGSGCMILLQHFSCIFHT